MSKGEAGEELFASFFVIALVFVFIFSAIGVYGNFMEGQASLYAERSASSVAEHVYFDSNGYLTLSECANLNRTYNAMNSTAIKITYWKNDAEQSCASGKLDVRSLSVSSMPVIIVDGTNHYPGRIDAMVGV